MTYSFGVFKFSADQPRVPLGSPAGGQFASEGGAGGGTAERKPLLRPGQGGGRGGAGSIRPSSFGRGESIGKDFKDGVVGLKEKGWIARSESGYNAVLYKKSPNLESTVSLGYSRGDLSGQHVVVRGGQRGAVTWFRGKSGADVVAWAEAAQKAAEAGG